MLKGELGTFSIGEVFQSLAINNHTGTLKVTPRSGPPKLIYFEQGQITLFSMGSAAGSRIGDILVRGGSLTHERLSEALEEQKQTKELLGAILVRKGYITGDDLRRALERKIREEICELFLWKEGSFEFHLDYFPDDQLDEMQKASRVVLDVNAVTMEGLRQLDEWAVIRKAIRTSNEILAVAKNRYEGDDPLALTLLSRIDGSTPVKELLKSAPGSRFECSKKLHELVEGGHIRPLTLEELRVHADNRASHHKHLEAVPFLQFAVELQPEDAELHVDLARALSGCYQEDPASRTYLTALRLFFAEGDHKRAAEAGERIVRRSVLEDDDLEKLLHCHISLGNARKAGLVGNQLVTSLAKAGDFRKAATVTEALAAVHPGDLSIQVQTATLLDKAGDRQAAMLKLEPLARDLESQKRFRELGKVLRLMLDLDPTRQDLKNRLGELQQLQERHAKRKRRRLTVIGAAIVSGIVIALVPILYEVKAAGALGHAERLEDLGRLTSDYSRAKEAYEALWTRYPLSSRARIAKEALHRIGTIETEARRTLEEEALRCKKEQDEKLGAMRDAVAAALDEADAAIRSGDVATAHEIYRRIKRDYSELSATREVKFPLRIDSYPTGATLAIDGKEVGKTPYLHHYHPGTEIQVSLKRSSCEPLSGKVVLQDQWELDFALHRSPLADFMAVMTIEQPIVVVQGLLFIVSRDGVLYALDPQRRSVSWQRTVGRFGDRISNLGADGGDIYLGTASAEVAAIVGRTGGSRWVSRVGGCVLAAPAISADGAWVAVGTTKGTVEVLDNRRKGELLAKFATENEVVASPVFLGDLVVAGSTDNALYGYSMSEKRLVFMEELDADIALDLRVRGRAVFAATRDGKCHAFDTETRRLLWSAILCQEGETATGLALEDDMLLVGTSRGNLHSADLQTGAIRWTVPLGKDHVSGLASYRGKAYLSLESGKLVAVDTVAQKSIWQYRSDATLLAPPTVHGGLVYLGGASGRIWSIEVVE